MHKILNDIKFKEIKYNELINLNLIKIILIYITTVENSVVAVSNIFGLLLSYLK